MSHNIKAVRTMANFQQDISVYTLKQFPVNYDVIEKSFS